MKTSISTRKRQVMAGIVAGAAVALAPLACAGTANAAPLPLEQPGNAQDIHGWHGGWYGGGHFGHGFGGPGFGRGWYGGPRFGGPGLDGPGWVGPGWGGPGYGGFAPAPVFPPAYFLPFSIS